MSEMKSSPTAQTIENPPVALCTECPRETCLEFSVVDYWGNLVKSPTQFELDGKLVKPDTPIRGLRPGKHILKAVDGEDLRQEILSCPYTPKQQVFSPAFIRASNEGTYYKRIYKTELWNGITLYTYKIKLTPVFEKDLPLDFPECLVR